MLVEITGSCGHTKPRDVKNSENRYEEPTNRQVRKETKFWSTRICSDCYRDDVSQRLERFGTLPTLEGSEKQASWATRLRQYQLLKVNEFLGNLLSYIDTLDLDSVDDSTKCYDNISNAEKLAEMLASVTDAKFWIDTRDEDAQILVGIDYSRDHQVKFDLETGEVVLATRAGTKLVEMSSRNETSPSKVIRVGGKLFHDRLVKAGS